MKRQRSAIASHQLDWDLKAVAVELALLRLRIISKLFNPLQPRVPAGTSDGGQWTGGNAQGASNESFIQPAAGRESDRLSGRELAQDPYLNRHIMDEHVGRTDKELMARVSEMQGGRVFGLLPSPADKKRAGTFETIEAAKGYISETLARNEEQLNRVAKGLEEMAFLESRFGYETGREAVSIPRNTPIRMRKTYGVGVLIAHDPSNSKGFRIITAYPNNAGIDYFI